MALDARPRSDIDLPAVRVAAAAVVAAAADRDWYQQASRHGDGEGAQEQKGGYEAS